MRALVLHGPRDLRYEHVADPVLTGSRDALIRVERAGICGSDLHSFLGTGFSSGVAGMPAAYCIGHEAIGEVVEIGADVRQLHVGNRVMLSAGVGCGECGPCLARHFLNCETIGFRAYGGSSGLGGCQAELVVVPAADLNAAVVPDGIGFDAALMLTDNLPTAYLGCVNAEVTPGKTVVVIGLGPIGLLTVDCALLMGASQVFGIDRSPQRRARAEASGASVSHPDDAREFVLDATKGRGVQCIVDAAGGPEAIALGIRVAATTAVVSVVGLATGEMPFPIGTAFTRGLTLRASVCPVPLYWPILMPLVAAGRLDPARYVTHVHQLSDGLAAYERLTAGRERRGDALKAVLTP
jgi:2-desacetyl-2-hydroxyethyl bacteriochlorophyllide A dehydrogenase